MRAWRHRLPESVGRGIERLTHDTKTVPLAIVIKQRIDAADEGISSFLSRNA